MRRTARVRLIKEIQLRRGSQLVVYITGDRTGLETRIGTDVFPMFHSHLAGASKHLVAAGGKRKIDLFLYSAGGVTMAGYALVNLFREFCDEFNVIIPFKALSCATLISLGANEVVMTPMGQLSPIDPSVYHPLGPLVEIPGHPPGIAPVNVEDVNGYIQLAREEVRLRNQTSMTRALELLAGKVNPLVLGAIQRSRAQIAFLASTLMSHYMDDDGRIERTVEVLTRQRFSHDYIIGRREAKETLGLNVVEPDDVLTDLILSLFGAYSGIMELDTPYHPETLLGKNDAATGSFVRGVIESQDLTHAFQTTKEVKRVEVAQPGQPPTIGYQERVLEEAWVESNNL